LYNYNVKLLSFRLGLHGNAVPVITVY